MNFNELKKVIPYKWRVQSFSKYSATAQCVAYIDARQVMDLLDDVVKPENWQAKFSSHKDNLFCELGIKIGDEWVWKSDCGVESNIEQQKGEASDAFKRAAVHWGIGRFLYSLDIKTVKTSGANTGNNRPHVIDDNGTRVWDITRHINDRADMMNKQAPAPASTPEPYSQGAYPIPDEPPPYLNDDYVEPAFNKTPMNSPAMGQLIPEVFDDQLEYSWNGDNGWNGLIYGRGEEKSIYLGGQKLFLSQSSIEILKQHKNYREKTK